ncbi:hypothetical protein PHMEG_00030447 [Phytophthora megakarya]|uniref:Uncharacterized protein n=1 Tax=Phytophthora megakarya TaxID=4795 RepID=A0A225V113_9STRA|nr:hypothetical protein PHMEG_00030447 [Phytophthora megakarya]
MSDFSKKNILPMPADATNFDVLVVHQTLEASKTFLGELRVTDYRWQLGTAATIQSHFSASHESFVRVHQAIHRQDVFSVVKAAKADSVRNVRSNRVNEQDQRVTIPVDVRKV